MRCAAVGFRLRNSSNKKTSQRGKRKKKQPGKRTRKQYGKGSRPNASGKKQQSAARKRRRGNERWNNKGTGRRGRNKAPYQPPKVGVAHSCTRPKRHRRTASQLWSRRSRRGASAPSGKQRASRQLSELRLLSFCWQPSPSGSRPPLPRLLIRSWPQATLWSLLLTKLPQATLLTTSPRAALLTTPPQAALLTTSRQAALLTTRR